MLSADKLAEFSKEIKQTGFPLEHHVAAAFERENWLIISNKYYLDDIHEVPKEIDLLAYKMSKIGHLNVFTTVIISCKKSDEHAWALLSRKADLKNPNTDWWPLHVWSNDKVITFEMDQPDKKKNYYTDVMAKGVLHTISQPASEIFAFQEMKISNGKVGNDKAIFASINSLLQAQAYELGALSERKKDPSAYQFNLLSILDGEMVKLNFDNKEITPSSIDNEHYISRYIIKKKQTFSRVFFLKKDGLDDIIKDYNRLHMANCEVFKKTYDDFFLSAIEDSKRRNLLLEDFRKEIHVQIYWLARFTYKISLDSKDFGLYWNSENKTLNVIIECSSSRGADFIEKINKDQKAKEIVSQALSKIYRYSGPFIFEDEIPF